MSTQMADAIDAKRHKANMGILSQFIAINRRLSRRLTPTHIHEANAFGVYRKLGAILLSHPKTKRVVDCGAGAAWQFPDYYKRWYDIHLIGLDIDANEMDDNRNLDEKIQCDVTTSIPVAPDSIDLFMISSGVEHFKNNDAFLRNAFLALRPGGFLIAQFPGRYAPFAIVNRLLPKKAARSLIRVATSDDAGVLGFTAYYDRTHYSAFAAMAKENGFSEVYHCPGFYSSYYAEFFFPLWILSYAYDILRFALGIRNLASYNVFLFQKPAAISDCEPMKLYAWK